jgi:hypothetical protein
MPTLSWTLPQTLSKVLSPQLSSPVVDQITNLARRIGSYPALRLSGQYSPLVADVMTLSSLVAGGIAYEQLRKVTLPAPVVRTIQFVVDASQTKDADSFAQFLAITRLRYRRSKKANVARRRERVLVQPRRLR